HDIRHRNVTGIQTCPLPLSTRSPSARHFDASRISSNRRAEGDLVDWLAESGIVGISDVDTRALTRHLREAGSMRVGIFSGPAAEAPEAELLARVQASPQMTGAKLVDEVSITDPPLIPATGQKRFSVAAVDLGIKSMTP